MSKQKGVKVLNVSKCKEARDSPTSPWEDQCESIYLISMIEVESRLASSQTCEPRPQRDHTVT